MDIVVDKEVNYISSLCFFILSSRKVLAVLLSVYTVGNVCLSFAF